MIKEIIKGKSTGKTTICICDYCGEEFKRKYYWAINSKHSFCNRFCSASYFVGENGVSFGLHILHTDAAKLKISESNKGKIPWNKGLKGVQIHSEETKKKMSEYRKGRIVSDETKSKIGLKHLGVKLSEEHKKKISESSKGKPGYWLGKHFSAETIKKLSVIAKNKKGEKGANWQGGITPAYLLARASLELKNWRLNIFERDNYACQECGDNRGHNLNAHHIKAFADYPELRFELSNGITYCKDCHKELHKKVYQENRILKQRITELELQTA